MLELYYVKLTNMGNYKLMNFHFLHLKSPKIWVGLVIGDLSKFSGGFLEAKIKIN